MGGVVVDPAELRAAVDAVRQHQSKAEAARQLGIPRTTLSARLKIAERTDISAHMAQPIGSYDLERGEKTPQEAWDEHADAFEVTVSRSLRNRWRVIERPKGPFCIFHSTDEHLDDDATPLRLIEADIARAHDMGAIMCHGGDALNNWPVAGRLAKKWADQECTLPSGLLRLQHFIGLFKPDVWTDGNHEEMNPYLSSLIKQWLPAKTLTDYWSVNFLVRTPDADDVRCIMSHKFQKGSSWFHKTHGHIREMLEGEPADILMDGHLHCDGVMVHTIPERGHSSLLVASAGYKVADEYAARISRGGKIPKLRGRAHWIVTDPLAAPDQDKSVAFKCPDQAESYLNGLQNLRAV